MPEEISALHRKPAKSFMATADVPDFWTPAQKSMVNHLPIKPEVLAEQGRADYKYDVIKT